MRPGSVDQKASGATVAGDTEWPNALYINWNPSNRKAKLNANRVENRNRNWAAPVLRDCS